MPVLENNYLNKKQLATFDSMHSGHPVQIVNEEEIDKTEWKAISWTENRINRNVIYVGFLFLLSTGSFKKVDRVNAIDEIRPFKKEKLYL